ncbi:32848_t:CDS:1, partial [Racocetra persica]
MSNNFNEILANLLSMIPVYPNPIPRPVDRTPSLQDQIVKIRNKLLRTRPYMRKTQLAYTYYLGELIEENPLEQRIIRREVSIYYYKASIRVYNIFESLGIQQIFRATNTTLAKIN